MDRTKLNNKRFLRKNRTRKTVGKGTSEKPRLSVYRSNKYIHAQIIDDNSGKTLISASSKEVNKEKGTKSEKASKLGKILAEKALKEDIKNVFFDRGEYRYHGRVKALAEGAREGGLNF
ncbi:MAG: 50S ribosomal protein L18 [Candidatus Paceibacterota bacterium]